MDWPLPQTDGVTVTHEPLVTGSSQSIWTLWVRELRVIWFWILFLSFVPCLLYGSVIFSVMVLFFAVLIVVPSAAIGQLFVKGSWEKNLRRLVVIFLVPILTIVYGLQVDKLIPEYATPITTALESFREESGHYPDTLDALIPKYLANIPDVRFSVYQPQITYRVTEGKPYLRIPSVAGDMFAMYEYDFESKTWKHHS